MNPLRRRFHKDVVFGTAVRLRGEHSVLGRIEELRAVERETATSVEARQREALAELLRTRVPQVPRLQQWSEFSVTATPENAVELLRRLPILEKEEVQADPGRSRVRDWEGRFATKTTGGSTGRPVTIHKDPEAIAQEMAATWLAYGWFGLDIGDPCVRFWGQPMRNWKRRLRYVGADLAMNRITLSAFGYTRETLDRYVETIQRFRPRYLYGYVSALEDLARHVLDAAQGERVFPSLRCVITTSEVLSPPQRRVLQQAFGVPVQNEYGCGEVGPIAYECPEGSLHLLPTNHYVEILRADGEPAAVGEPGSVVITDLTNRVMPLVRYRVGDTASFGGPCTCGRPFPVLGDVFGREYDYVETEDGRRYHGEFFMYLFEDLRRDHPEIGQFQVVQTELDRLEVKIVANGAGTRSHATVVSEMSRRLPGFRVDVRDVDQLERRPSGKMLVVENRMQRERGGTGAPLVG